MPRYGTAGDIARCLYRIAGHRLKLIGMRLRLHVMLCWLLLVALPLQGWAASSMALCATAHTGVRDASGPMAVASPAAHPPCHTHAQFGHDETGHEQATARPAVGQGHATAPDPSPAALSAGGCALCALCAHATSSLPSAGCACPAPNVGRGFEPAPRTLPALSFLTPGVERPPR